MPSTAPLCMLRMQVFKSHKLVRAVSARSSSVYTSGQSALASLYCVVVAKRDIWLCLLPILKLRSTLTSRTIHAAWLHHT